MLQNETELEHSYATLAKLYRLRDKCAAETLWSAAGRTDVVAGIENQIRKIEKEIAEYLTKQPEKVA